MEKYDGSLKVHEQGFLKLPISGQEVMIITVKYHLKHCLTFARAPCTRHFFEAELAFDVKAHSELELKRA